MKNVSSFLSGTIDKALLANGVQLTGKELVPVSRQVAEYVYLNEEAFNEAFAKDKKVRAEVDAAEAQAERERAEAAGEAAGEPVKEAPANLQPAPAQGGKGKWWRQQQARAVTAEDPAGEKVLVEAAARAVK